LQVTKECETVLIEKHREKMQEECETMFREDRQPGMTFNPFPSLFLLSSSNFPLLFSSDLTRMFHLLSRINGIKPMLDVLEKYVTEFGMEKVKAIPDAAMKVIFSFPLLFPFTSHVHLELFSL
jgi:hypothetical protein